MPRLTSIAHHALACFHNGAGYMAPHGEPLACAFASHLQRSERKQTPK